jgi:ADP-ribose pyrophosphatase YjhB (NUDIX family)
MTGQQSGSFIIRVYALIISDRNEVLVTDEFQLGMKMTKFPGGGMNFGEGTVDCLKRELMEECRQEITDIQHFYTTDFYQQALFFENRQLISIYYLARISEPFQFRISEKPFDFEQMENGNQSFRWLPAPAIDPDDFTFPIDKHVAQLLKEYLNG